MNIVFGFPLAYSHVHCQGAELEKRDSLKKSEVYLFAEMFVYNKKKIQMFLLNMALISLVKWKIFIFHE